MDLRSCPVKGLCFILATLLLIAIITIAQINTEDGHDFMSDPNRCNECHIGEPVFGETDYRELRFTEDIVTLCHKCHTIQHLKRGERHHCG